MVIAEARRALRDQLSQAGLESAAFEADCLLTAVTGLSRAQLLAQAEGILSEPRRCRLFALADRRRLREPLQYLIGSWEFYGRRFACRADALIPRPESELLVELALRLLPRGGRPRVLDLCCGSGCIGLSIACETPCELTMIDLSEPALKLAAENAAALGVTADILRHDLLRAPPAMELFDLIVCNPPYLTEQDMRQLQPELAYEPPMALFGGADGLTFYGALAGWTGLLKEGGRLLAEHGAAQGEAVTRMLDRAGLCDLLTHPDYAGLPRVTGGSKKPCIAGDCIL